MTRLSARSSARSHYVQYPTRKRVVAPCVTASLTAGLAPAAFTAVVGGALSGGLHAVSGPDHLAAVLPSCIGKRWWVSSRVGALWALGHSISSFLLGILAFYLKGRLSQGAGTTILVKSFASWAELAVGGSLIAIGVLGIREARGFEVEEKPMELAPSEATSAPRRGGKRAIVLNGILHGFSWDGTPSLAPALALPSLGAVLLFLFAYCGGTMVAMSTVTTIIGEGSLRVGEKLDQPDLPQKLAFFSSGIALAVGLFWSARALPSILR